MILFFTLLLLISLSAFLSGSETALFSLSPMTLKYYQKSDSQRRRTIATLMKSPRNVLVTLLMINILVNILVQNTVANLFEESSWGLKVGLPLFLTLICGEVLPKTTALPKNKEVAPLVAPIVAKLAQVLGPLRKPLTKLTNYISHFFAYFLKKEEAISTDELRHALQESEEHGVLLPQECDLIAGTFDLYQLLVKERMRPREEMVYFDVNEPLSKLLDLFVDQEITRIPVCDGSLENLLGMISAKGFFLQQELVNESSDLKKILQKPFFIPESLKAASALKILREKGFHMAVVVNEYGSISGLITQEDLIETVVGEIKDRRDQTSRYTRSGKEVIIASGKLDLSEFKLIFNIPLKSKENIVTLAGWLIEQMGDIPTVGMKYVTDQFLFYILAADPNRIRRIYVRCLSPVSKKRKKVPR